MRRERSDGLGGGAKRILELDPDSVRLTGHRPYAVVDIGSNSVRLVIYNELSRAPFPRFNEKSLCGLGAGLERTGLLAALAMDHTVHAVDRYCTIARAMEVERIDILATEAVRRAGNGHELTQAITDRTGLEVRILSGQEEARYAAQGVIAGFYRPKGLVGDLGGGSLEVAEVLDDRVGERFASLPLGALPVRAMMALADSDPKRRVDEILEGQLPPPLTSPVLYLVGGGWRALARVHMAMNNAPVRVTHGYGLDAKEARALAKSIWRMPAQKVTALPGVPSRRTATLPAASLVLDRVLKSLKPERVVFSALGLREGWLYSRLPEAERYLDPLIEGAQAVGVPRSRVASLAPALARWTETLFAAETTSERRLRLAVCALSDIAWTDHADVQALQTFHRLVQFPFIGLDHGERVFIAATIHARYDGKAGDQRLSPAIGLLSQAQQRRAQILGRAILLGYRFSGTVPEILDSARLRIDADCVRLEVTSTEHVPDSEAVRARMKQLAAAIGVHRIELTKVV